jgi:hypothetical protein
MTQNLNFGQAIEALKEGKKVARNGWNGKGMFLWIMAGVTLPLEKLQHLETIETVKALNLSEVTFLPTIRMFTANGEILTGWLASQSDMLSEDWCIVK